MSYHSRGIVNGMRLSLRSGTRWQLSCSGVYLLVLVVMIGMGEVSGARERPDRQNEVGLQADTIRGAATIGISYFHKTRSNVDDLAAMYSVIGPMKEAEGRPQQIHPSNCDMDIHVIQRPWIAIIILEESSVRTECTVFELAMQASTFGASAVIFDIKNNQQAAKQLREHMFSSQLHIPVVLIDGRDAARLRIIVQNGGLNTSDIYIQESFDEGPSSVFIILGLVIVIVIACIVTGIIIKFKCHRNNEPASVADVAKGVLSKMRTRKFIILDMDLDACAICLEDYKEGQELRTLPCNHEYHKKCVDPWLIKNRPLCPLCLYNIIDGHSDNDNSICSTSDDTPPRALHAPLAAPSLVRQSNQSEGQYYNTTPNIAGIHGYPFHQGMVSDHGNDAFRQLLLPPVDLARLQNHQQPVNNMYPQQYSALQTHAQPFSNVNYQLLRYNVLPLVPGPGLTPGVEIPNFEPLINDCVHSTAIHKGGCVNRNSGVYGGANRRRIHTRHKPGLPRSRSQTASRLHTHGMSDVVNSSSDSEHEKKINRTSRLPTYASSHCDADVSETSTGGQSAGDSDGPGGGSTNLSIKSVFGSSEVPSDISSCDSNVYGAEGVHEDIGRAEGGADPSARLPPLEGAIKQNGVLLQPACMSGKRSAARRHKTMPNDMVSDSWGGVKILAPRGTPEADDSDHTVSSVDTSSLSPYVSGWSSNNDGRSQVPTSQGPLAVVCPLCHGHNASYGQKAGQQLHPPPTQRSDPLLLPLRNEQLKSRPPMIQTLHGRPPDINSTFYHPRPFDMMPEMASHMYNAQVTMETTIQPQSCGGTLLKTTEHHWETLPVPYPISPHTENLPTGSLSKAGSTCSFYCYPSNQHSSPGNQHSSSASSSPLHTHRPTDVSTGATNSHHHANSHHGNRKSLVVHSNYRGNVTTNTLGAQIYPFGGNMV